MTKNITANANIPTRASPPITPPTIAPTGVDLVLDVEEVEDEGVESEVECGLEEEGVESEVECGLEEGNEFGSL
jgi:hypothetical protein